MGAWLMRLTSAAAARIPLGMRLGLYRLGPLTRWLRRALNRAAPTGVHPVRVAAGPLRGRWLLLDLQVDKDLWLGTYEPQLADAIRSLAPPGAVVWDLGANVGYTSLLLAQAVGQDGRVVALEPLPENLERLREAIRLNDLDRNVEVVAAAAGERSGPGRFLRHASPGMGRLTDAGEPSAIEVEVLALDDFVYGQSRPAPALVKVDLEGGEGPALRGMVRVLREARPLLLVELHGPQAQASVESVLRGSGYSVHEVAPGFPEREPGRPALHLLGQPGGSES